MSLVLVLRPQPGAAATAERATARGLTPLIAPLFTARAITWEPPNPADHDAVLMTSAQAARLGGDALSRFIHLPLYAVGGATAEAARTAGFDNIIAGDGDGAAILGIAATQGNQHVLHLAGREHKALSAPGVSVVRRIVYAADAVATLPSEMRPALERGAVVLLHSPRAAAHFATLIDAEHIDRSTIHVAALSPAVRDTAGVGWAAAVSAPSPNDDALLAIAAILCNQEAVSRTSGGEGRI